MKTVRGAVYLGSAITCCVAAVHGSYPVSEYVYLPFGIAYLVVACGQFRAILEPGGAG